MLVIRLINFFLAFSLHLFLMLNYACFSLLGMIILQIRCKDPNVCTKHGTIVMVTDLNTSNQTDFVVSSGALRAMANMGNDQDIIELVKSSLDVEYKRLVCTT